MGLEELRQRIDEVDREIIRLLEERFDIVKEIAELKNSLAIRIEDDAREKKVIENCMKVARKLDKDFVKNVMHLILKQSKEIQRGKKNV